MSEEFYKRGIEEFGVDYNFYGDWQKQYAKMIISITKIIADVSNNSKNSLILDVGCACGVILKGFKFTKVFNQYLGIDKSEYMIELGKKTHGFSDDELVVCDITKKHFPCEDNSVSFLHCSNVLEHINNLTIIQIINEMHRVLKPKTGYGLIIVPAIAPGVSKEKIENDDSHINLQTFQWWNGKLNRKFRLDKNLRNNFKNTKFSPTNDKNTFYHYYNDSWTLFGFRKEK